MAKKVKDPGFGYKSSKDAKELISKDGTSNVKHINSKKNWAYLYSYLLDITWSRFFFYVISFYTLINILFAIFYYLLGVENITISQNNFWEDFLNAFFFSTQTITTVGYGTLSPNSIPVNIVASLQGMLGWIGFSFITGILYGRFSKPKAVIKFSKNIIVRDFNEKRALMLRLMNSRKNVMIEPKAAVTLSISEKDKNTEEYNRVFYRLELQREKIMYLPTMWTIVHELNDKSPLTKYSNQELKKLDAELYILIEYHDEAFAQKLFKIYSYRFDKLKTDVAFESSFYFDEDGYTVLDHDKLDEVKPL